MNAENERRRLYRLINGEPLSREQLEQLHGRVWSAEEAAREFTLFGFQPPFAVVRRIRGNQFGSLIYQENPRYYFRFESYTMKQ